MKITLNNKEKKIDSNISVRYFIESMGFSPEKTLVTKNGETLSLDEFDSAIIIENDDLELFSFVGGG